LSDLKSILGKKSILIFDEGHGFYGWLVLLMPVSKAIYYDKENNN
jgi:hypothetical protein